MAIKTYKPTTAARRNMSVTDYTSLSKNGPEKSLLAPLSNKSGRIKKPAATATAASPSATVAAATARSTALSTSSARSTT